MGTPAKIMLIRHAEKPGHQAAYGIGDDGKHDDESLTVRGWQRAGALVGLFAPKGNPPASPIATPTTIYASAAAGGSKRPLQTITPLAAKLRLVPVVDYSRDQVRQLSRAVLAQQGVVLVCWQHERLRDIATEIMKSTQTQPTMPANWPDDRFDVVWILTPPTHTEGSWQFAQAPQLLLSGDQASTL